MGLNKSAFGNSHFFFVNGSPEKRTRGKERKIKEKTVRSNIYYKNEMELVNGHQSETDIGDKWTLILFSPYLDRA